MKWPAFFCFACGCLFIACLDQNRTSETTTPIPPDSYNLVNGHFDSARYFFNKALADEEVMDYRAASYHYRKALQQYQSSGNDSMMIQTLGNLGIALWETQQNDEAIIVFFEQLKRIQKSNYTELLPACYNNLGLTYHTQDEYLNAIKYYSLAIHEFRERKNNELLATSLLNLGILLKNQGIFDNALELLLEAEPYLRRGGDSLSLASCYEALGLVNHELGEYEEAIQQHRDALEIRIDRHYRRGIGKSLNNIGLGYMYLQQYDSALIYFKGALDVKKNTGISRLLISTMENIGKLYDQTGDLIQADQYYRDAIVLAEEEGVSNDLASLYHLIAALKIRQNSLQKAKNYLDKALAPIEKIDSKSLKIENLRLRKEWYFAAGNYPMAIQFYDEYVRAQEKLLNKEKTNYIAQLKILHQVSKKERENELLKQKALVQEARLSGNRFKLYFLLLALIGSLCLVWVKIRSNKRVKLTMRELHHRVKNNLQLLSGLFSLQSRKLTDRAAIEAVKSSESRVNAMAIIHQKLYQKTDLSSVDMFEFTELLTEYLQKIYGFSPGDLRLELQIEHLHIDVDKAIPMGLIINELVSNSFKHALKGHPNPTLSIQLQRKSNKTQLVIRDNGPGLPAAKEQSNKDSFGMKMVYLLTRQLKGELKIQSTSEGTICELLT